MHAYNTHINLVAGLSEGLSVFYSSLRLAAKVLYLGINDEGPLLALRKAKT